MSGKERGTDDPIDPSPTPTLSVLASTAGISTMVSQRLSSNAMPTVQEPSAPAAVVSTKQKKKAPEKSGDDDFVASSHSQKQRAAKKTGGGSASRSRSPKTKTSSKKKSPLSDAESSPPRSSQRVAARPPKTSDDSMARAKGAERAGRKTVRESSRAARETRVTGADDSQEDPKQMQRSARRAARQSSRSPVRPPTSAMSSKAAERESRRIAARHASRSPVRQTLSSGNVAVGVSIATEGGANNLKEDDIEFQPGAIRVGGILEEGADESMLFTKNQDEEDPARNKKLDDSFTDISVSVEDSTTGEKDAKESNGGRSESKGSESPSWSIKDVEAQGGVPVVAHLAPDEAELTQRISERVEEEVNKRLLQQSIKPSEGAVVQAMIVEEDDEDGTCVCCTKPGLCALLLVGIAIIVTLVVVLGGTSKGTVLLTLAPTPSPTSVPSATPTQFQFSARFDQLLQLIGPDVSETPETTLRNLETAQFRAMTWMADTDTLFANLATQPKQSLIERYALAVIYESTGGDTAWRSSFNFLSGRPTCSWNDAQRTLQGGGGQPPNGDGVFCNNAGVPFRLFLGGNGLEGTLPTELGLLTSLGELRLNDNDLTGTIPSELFGLTGLGEVDLSENGLFGTLSPEIGQLTNLRRKFAALRNGLSGLLPSELGLLTELRELLLFDNGFTGTLPIEIGGAANLVTLNVGDNNLSGTLPTEIGLLSNMQDELRISNNGLGGMLPTELGQLTLLPRFEAHSLALTGNIPTEFGLLTVLRGLGLQNNNLSGELPSEMGRMTSLVAFRFSGNRGLIGTVPMEFTALTALDRFEGSQTNLSGGFEEVFCDRTMRPEPVTMVVADCGGNNPKLECSCCSNCN